MNDHEIVQKVNEYWAKRGIKANARIEYRVILLEGTKHTYSQVVSDQFLACPTNDTKVKLFGEADEIKLKKMKDRTLSKPAQ